MVLNHCACRPLWNHHNAGVAVVNPGLLPYNNVGSVIDDYIALICSAITITVTTIVIVRTRSVVVIMRLLINTNGMAAFNKGLATGEQNGCRKETNNQSCFHNKFYIYSLLMTTPVYPSAEYVI